ncbi:MAG: DUF177 domain-containing protein [Myxococcota bacterium]|nr:DUF177 domain-containing protein [Myxococcota bacterium]
MSVVSFDISGLIQGELEQEFGFPTDELQERLGKQLRPQSETFKVELKVQLLGNVLETSGTIKGGFEFECGRCIETKKMTIKIPFRHRFMKKGELGNDSSEAVEELDLSEYSGQVIEMDELLLEYLIVELPFAPTCEHAELKCPKWTDNPSIYTDDHKEWTPDESPWLKALKDVKVPKP